MEENYYDILGVSKTASDEEIKSAYRKLAKQYHPDLFAGKPEAEKKNAEEKFKKINHAYQVLSDSQKRANYDQFGSEEGPQFSSAGGGGFSGGFGDFGDIFSNIFSGFGSQRSSSRANSARPGDDIQIRCTIDFQDSVKGVVQDLKFRRKEVCPSCNGSGAKSASAIKTCTKCGGSGVVRVNQNTIFGSIVSETTCPDCKGKGKIVTEVCKDCLGKGFVTNIRTVHAKIPAGINDGQTLVYRGDGDCGLNGAPNGNLIILINVKSHPLFVRKGFDINYELPISFVTATLGGEVDIPTPYGPYKYKIPEGTQTGSMFKIKGKGMKYLNKDYYGDLIVFVKVVTPSKLTKLQKDALSSFANSLSPSQEEQIKKFNDYLK